MNAFQILDKDGIAIPINTLDEIAAKFWNRSVGERYYASPYTPFVNKKNLEGEELKRAKLQHEHRQESRGNWFDIIGWRIANQGNWCSGWANVVVDLLGGIVHHFVDTEEGYKERPVKVAFFEHKEPNQLCLPEETEKSIYFTLEWARPYIELINHFQSLGYQPKQIKE